MFYFIRNTSTSFKVTHFLVHQGRAYFIVTTYKVFVTFVRQTWIRRQGCDLICVIVIMCCVELTSCRKHSTEDMSCGVYNCVAERTRCPLVVHTVAYKFCVTVHSLHHQQQQLLKHPHHRQRLLNPDVSQSYPAHDTSKSNTMNQFLAKIYVSYFVHFANWTLIRLQIHVTNQRLVLLSEIFPLFPPRIWIEKWSCLT